MFFPCWLNGWMVDVLLLFCLFKVFRWWKDGKRPKCKFLNEFSYENYKIFKSNIYRIYLKVDHKLPTSYFATKIYANWNQLYKFTFLAAPILFIKYFRTFSFIYIYELPSSKKLVSRKAEKAARTQGNNQKLLIFYGKWAGRGM